MVDESSVDLLGLNFLEAETSLVPFETRQKETSWVMGDVLLQFQQVDFNQQPWQPPEENDVRDGRKRRISSFQQDNWSSFSSNVICSILDDRTFCPPPPLPIQNNIMSFDAFADINANSSLPSFERVMHAGKILSRISIRSLITRSWKEVFWIIYDTHQLIFFRCMRDYEEWLLNPYLSEAERELLIKLKIDFEKDLSVTGIRGYQHTDVKPKSYRRRGILFQFKVDSMTRYGPSLVGAFASSDQKKLTKLHCLFYEMMKRSPLNSSLLKLNMSHKAFNGPRRESKL
jgi:hypothetical protein